VAQAVVNYEPIDGVAIAATLGVWAVALWCVLLTAPVATSGRIAKWMSALVLVGVGLVLLWNTSVQLWSVPR